MKVFNVLILVVLLSACAGGGDTRPSMTVHDLSAAAAPQLLVRNVDVVPGALATGSSMAYRFNGKTARSQFAQNRWSAPPPELIEERLKRGLPEQPTRAINCNLRIELSDLVQVFDDSQRSQLLLDARAVLFTPQGVLARRNFELSQPSGSDASSAARASGPLVQALALELQPWIAQHCK